MDGRKRTVQLIPCFSDFPHIAYQMCFAGHNTPNGVIWELFVALFLSQAPTPFGY